MLDRALVFLDLETTGAAAHSDRITEIGLVEVDRGRHIGEWSSLVNPERPISPMIESLTGITDAMVADAPTFAELADELFERLAGKTLVAHNARFDYGFLQNEFRRVGLKYAPDVLCTVRLSRHLYPQERRHNLDSLIERHGFSCESRHRALADARVLWDFTQRIHRDIENTEINPASTRSTRRTMSPCMSARARICGHACYGISAATSGLHGGRQRKSPASNGRQPRAIWACSSGTYVG